MRKRSMRGYVAALTLAAGLCMTQGLAVQAATDGQGDSGTDSGYTAADPSKGVTYIKNDSGSTIGMNLNGNSVVICTSKNATEQIPYINIYEDKNQNGIVDQGETAFKLDGSADIIYSSSMPIYGLYQQTYDQPVSITIDGAKLGYVYGLSNGALNTDSSKTALTLRIKNGATIGTVTGAENAAVEGSVAVEAGDGCSLSALYAVKTAGVSGDVSLNLNGGTYNGIGVVTSGAEVKKNLNVTMRNITLRESAKGAAVDSGCKIVGNVTFDADGVNALGGDSFTVLKAANCTGKLDVSLKNYTGSGWTFYGIESGSYVEGDTDIKILGGSGTFGSVYGINGSSGLKGQVKVLIENCTVSGAVYGASGCSFLRNEGVQGDSYDADITIRKNSAGGIIYGLYDVVETHSVKLTMEDLTGNGINVYGYYTGSANINGQADISISRCQGSNIWGYYGSNSETRKGYGKKTISITGCTAGNSIYGVMNGYLGDDCEIRTSGNICYDYYGIYNAYVDKNVKITSAHENDATILDKDKEPVINTNTSAGNGSYYIVYSPTIKGDLTADVNSIRSRYFYAINNVTLYGNADYKIRNSEITSTSSEKILFANNNSSISDSAERTTDVWIENTDFSKLSAVTFSNSLPQKATLNMTITDDCKLPSKYYVIPASSQTENASAVVKVKNDIYYGGKVILTENVTADNVYFGSYGNYSYGYAAVLIPEKITVTTKENVYIPYTAQVVNKGTIKAAAIKQIGSSAAAIYLNNGQIETESNEAGIKYPVVMKVDQNQGSMSLGSGEQTSLDPDTRYCKSGDVVTVYISTNKGYRFLSATVKKQSDTQASELAKEGNTYSFEMPDEQVVVTAAFEGIPIDIKKTSVDPSAVLNQTYTEKQPLYDLNRLIIMNDAKTGTISYKEDATYSLPEGLTLTEGRIIGTPTVLYEDGKRVDIHVTGRNGTEAVLRLNVIVSKVQKIQESTIERLTVDEENKTISLNGTSAVLQQTGTSDNGVILTGIYADDDRDGKADGRQAMYSGDLSGYTIYGISGIDYDRPIRITVLSGSVGSIFGVKSATMSYADSDSLVIDIQGGAVSTVYGLDSSAHVQYMRMKRGKEAAVGKMAIKNPSGYGFYEGYLIDQAGAITVEDYIVNEKLTGDSLQVTQYKDFTANAPVEITGAITLPGGTETTFNKGVTAGTFKTNGTYDKVWFHGTCNIDTFSPGYAYVYIEKDAVLKAEDIKIKNTSAQIFHKGAVSAKTFACTGKWMVDGAFAEDTDISDWSKLYFVVTVTSNLQDITSYSSAEDYAYEYREDEKKSYYYLPGNKTQNIKYKNITGYTGAISVNGGEPVEGDADCVCKLAFPQAASELYIDYIPKQITCSKQYADPMVVKGTQYTTADPAYDLSQIQIQNDTTMQYGGSVKYQLKSGSALPAGLKLEGTKVVGTLADDAETTEAVFRITGRNGSATECKITFTVQEEGYKITDLTKELNVQQYTDIDLKGHSVVILPDPSDSKKVSIYPDDDHDGIADNGNALKIAGATSYDLSTRAIIGYADTTAPYEGDISIYMYGGTIGSLYGARGKANITGSQAQVDGTVSLYIKGGKISSNTYIANLAVVKKAELYATAGTMYQYVYGLGVATADELVFQFTDQAQMAQTAYRENYKMYVTSSAVVNKSVNVRIGASGSRYAFANYNGQQITGSSSVFGLCDSTIHGSVKYDIIGNWEVGGSGKNYLSYNSTIDGDMDVLLDTNSFGVSGALENTTVCTLAYGGTVGDINITDKTGRNNYTVAANGIVDNIRAKRTVSGNVRGIVTYIYQNNNNWTLNGGLYAEDYLDLYLGGAYTIDKDVETRDIHTLKDSNITIADGVKVVYTGDADLNGTLTNKGSLTCKGDRYSKSTVSGTITNSGEISYTTVSTLTIHAGASVINHETGRFKFGKLTNNGTIINDGDLEQMVSSTLVGDILTSKEPSMMKTLSYYSTIYYKAELVYPEFCFEEGDTAPVQLAASTTGDMKTSGIEGDDAVYIRGNGSVKVTVTGIPIENTTVDSIVYGSSESVMNKSDETTWTAAMPYEPTVFTVNMKNDTATMITLDKDEDTVDTAVVGVTTTEDKPLYDLTALKIANDIDSAAARVGYSLAKGSVLPAGLELKNGRIYGTPTKAAAEAQTVTIKICGKNQTVASFKLTFTKVAKGTPVMETPDPCTGLAGKTLESVTLPTSGKGTYKWAAPETVIEKAGTKEYDAYFIPANTSDYDWSKADLAEGAYEELADGTIQIKVKISVAAEKQAPDFAVPTGLTGIYGQTLADVEIPETEGGSFVWTAPATKLEKAGSYTFEASYIPKNTEVYDQVDAVELTVTVEPVKAEFTQKIAPITVKKDTVLKDVELPDAEGGYYYWYTANQTILSENSTVQVCFKPDDSTNYDWTGNKGWNQAHRGIIFSVEIVISEEHSHSYTWKSDDSQHWKECSCGEILERAEHVFGKGEVTKAPTTSATGIMTYECTVCGYKKQEILPKKEETTDPGSDKPNPTPVKPNPTPNKPTTKVDISKASVTGIQASVIYTGKKLKQTPVVTVKGKTLSAKSDYTVKYKNNKNISKATITIIGKGKYTGTITKTFRIKVAKNNTYTVKGIRYKITKASTNGKGTVTVIGTTKKKSDKKFTKLSIKNTVKIGGVTFNVTAISKKAFKGYKYLKSATIGDKVKTVGAQAFYGCKVLTTVTIGKSVKTIGKSSFEKCTKLKKITFTTKKLTKVGKKAFKGISKKAVVTIPKKQANSYKSLLKKSNIPAKVSYKKAK